MKKLHWGLISTYRQELMGVACLWVIFNHNFFNWPTLLRPLQRVGVYGNCGVDIFLLLSGSSLYFAYSRKPKLGQFYSRRIVRLMVPYLMLAIPYWLWRDVVLQKGSFLLDITMLSFPLKGVVTTWYVGAIMAFYLLYPLIYKLLFETDRIGPLKLGRNTLAILLPACVAAGCLVVKRLFPEFYDNIEIGLTRLTIFFVGCKAGEWVFDEKPLSSELVWLSGVGAVFTVLLRETMSLTAYWIRMSYVLLAVYIVLLLTTLFHRFSWEPLKRVLVYFGDRSLEIYLSHVLLRNVFRSYLPVNIWDKWGILSYALVFTLSIAVSEIVHRAAKKLSQVLLHTGSAVKT